MSRIAKLHSKQKKIFDKYQLEKITGFQPVKCPDFDETKAKPITDHHFIGQRNMTPNAYSNDMSRAGTVNLKQENHMRQKRLFFVSNAIWRFPVSLAAPVVRRVVWWQLNKLPPGYSNRNTPVFHYMYTVVPAPYKAP